MIVTKADLKETMKDVAVEVGAGVDIGATVAMIALGRQDDRPDGLQEMIGEMKIDERKLTTEVTTDRPTHCRTRVIIKPI